MKTKKLFFTFFTLLIALVTGCSSTATYNPSYGRQASSYITPKYPGKLLIFTTPVDDKFVFDGSPKSVTGFAWHLKAPLGEMTKKTAGEIYGHLFGVGYEFGNVVNFQTNLFAAILYPQITDFSWRMNQAKNAGFAITPQVKMTLHLRLLSTETNGVIFDRQYESGWVNGNSYVVNFSFMESVNVILQKTIASLMVDSVRDLDATLQIIPTASESFVHHKASGAVSATGTGFFITENGYLLSNAHVVEDAQRIEVKIHGNVYPAQVIRIDSVNDIAILKVSGSFAALPIMSEHIPKLGDSVLTIGFPDPLLQGFEPKLTDGKISSLAGLRDDPRYFQISLPVQPGNSGGALVDSQGDVVGIVSARLSDKAAYAVSGALPQNVNYAVKIGYANLLLDTIPDLGEKLNRYHSNENLNFEDLVKEVQDATALVLVY